jgi:hypothetical protein
MAVRPTIDPTPREKIERQVAEFLAKGGTITVLPTTPNAFPVEVKDDKPAPQRACYSFHSIDSNRVG